MGQCYTKSKEDETKNGPNKMKLKIAGTKMEIYSTSVKCSYLYYVDLKLLIFW